MSVETERSPVFLCGVRCVEVEDRPIIEWAENLDSDIFKVLKD
jgi:hypothetical protein